MKEVRAIVEKQPKTVMLEKRFQIFSDWSVELDKFIFKGLIIFIVIIYSLAAINEYIRKRKYMHYKQAWQYLYSQQKEDYKMYLDRVWNSIRSLSRYTSGNKT